MMRPLLFVVGAALAAGAESQPDLPRLLVQALSGVALITVALLWPNDNEVS